MIRTSTVISIQSPGDILGKLGGPEFPRAKILFVWSCNPSFHHATIFGNRNHVPTKTTSFANYQRMPLFPYILVLAPISGGLTQLWIFVFSSGLETDLQSFLWDRSLVILQRKRLKAIIKSSNKILLICACRNFFFFLKNRKKLLSCPFRKLTAKK